MATTSPNYGWPEPTSSDFVKDGADAISDMGNAIDTTVNQIENFKGLIPHPFILMGA